MIKVDFNLADDSLLFSAHCHTVPRVGEFIWPHASVWDEDKKGLSSYEVEEVAYHLSNMPPTGIEYEQSAVVYVKENPSDFEQTAEKKH